MSTLHDIAHVPTGCWPGNGEKNGKTKQLSGSAEIHTRFDGSVFMKEEMYLEENKTLHLSK